MAAREYEVPVIVSGEEKWMTGLTKHTTCDDIIYAILQYESTRIGGGVDACVNSYVICEKWRNVERPLSGRTKIVKVWRAWGKENKDVKFILHHVEERRRLKQENKSKEKRHRSSSRRRGRLRRRDCESTDTELDFTAKRDRLDKENRVNPDKLCSNDFAKAKQLENASRIQGKALSQLIHLVIKQERKIQDQLARINDTDAQIAVYEDRLRSVKSGPREKSLDTSNEDSGLSSDDFLPNIKSQDLDAYLYICENITHIEDKLAHERDKIEKLSFQIYEESLSEPNFSEPIHKAAKDANKAESQSQIQNEEEQLRHELEKCLDWSFNAQMQIHLVEDSLGKCREQLQLKEDYMNRLSVELVGCEIDKVQNVKVKRTRFEIDEPESMQVKGTSRPAQCVNQTDKQFGGKEIKHAGLDYEHIADLWSGPGHSGTNIHCPKTNDSTTAGPATTFSCANNHDYVNMESKLASVSDYSKLLHTTSEKLHKIVFSTQYPHKSSRKPKLPEVTDPCSIEKLRFVRKGHEKQIPAPPPYKRTTAVETCVPNGSAVLSTSDKGRQTDSESDTGLSSMNSDDCHRIMETLV